MNTEKYTKHSQAELQAVELHKSENAWKLSFKIDAGDDENAKIQLYREVQRILSKLTPQKFDTLVKQVKQLDINTEERLNGVVGLVFEKAVNEPYRSVVYANMCKELAMMRVPLSSGEGCANFRKLLLTKCQREFEQDRNDELQRAEKMKQIELSTPEEKKKQLQEESEDEERKNRRRQLGNIRFIGELFKQNMLIEPIMHECIKKLLSQGDEDSLECLCCLLTTIGQQLETKRDKETNEDYQLKKDLMNAYITEMQKIVDKRQTSSRVRFMLQDVIDLKRHRWIPRIDENNPKIGQIHKEAEKPAQEQWQVLQNMQFPEQMPDDRRKTSGRDSDHDSYCITNKSSKVSLSVISKLRLTKPCDATVRCSQLRKTLKTAEAKEEGNETFFDDDDKDFETQKFYQNVWSILHKLTRQNLSRSVKQIKDMKVDTEEKLKAVVNLLYERAIDDICSSSLYALMCKQLEMIRVQVSNGTGTVSFGMLLADKCQESFEEDGSDCSEQLRMEEGEDEENQKLLQTGNVPWEKRELMFRNIRLTGELFRQNMVTELAIHECIEKLLKQDDDPSLMCLCHLLANTGLLEQRYVTFSYLQKEDEDLMGLYIAHMKIGAVDQEQTSSSIRSVVQGFLTFQKFCEFSEGLWEQKPDETEQYEGVLKQIFDLQRWQKSRESAEHEGKKSVA